VTELVVERNPGETRIAIREGGRTVELRFDRLGSASRIGTIFLARAVRIEPGIGAFLDIGERVPAFLPEGKERIVEGAATAVQIVADAVADKGPEATRLLVLDGGALALTAAQPGLSISRQLPESRRRRLRSRLTPLLGETVPGMLVRSSVRESDDLEAIWQALLDEWRKIESRLKGTPPLRLWTLPDPVTLLLRQLRPEKVIVGDAALAASLRAAVKIERPFEALGIEDEIARMLTRDIEIPGGRLVVEEGETLTAIDVNGAGDRLSLCLAAAREIGRLLRLRNLGGTLLVDFPFVEGKSGRSKIEAAMKEAVESDPLGVECLGWTRTGLYEMTRPKRGLSLAALLLEQRGPRATVETAALAALRALARAEGGKLRLVAASEVIAWLEGTGAPALAEAGRAVALAAEAGYGRERFEVVRV
jgi:ribonuclease G